jgi:hypothetical protein
MFSLFKGAVSKSGYIALVWGKAVCFLVGYITKLSASKSMMTDELERIWEEAVVT